MGEPRPKVRRASPIQRGVAEAVTTATQMKHGSGFNEVLLHVYWTSRSGEGVGNHLTMRDKVSADLGLDEIPDPPFTSAEMHDIMFAAKMAALKCLIARKRGRRG